MLRAAKTVLDRLCLTRWGATALSATGTVRIDIEGCDPRIVVVPRLWIERLSEPAGDVAAGVSWSAYSAGKDSRSNLVPLQLVPGAIARPVRAAAAPDGTIPQGDNLELICSTPLVLVVACADVSGTLTSAAGQSLWFALDAGPAEPSLSPEDFDALLHAIRCSQPAAIAVKVNT
jgi:hypothetical protein